MDAISVDDERSGTTALRNYCIMLMIPPNTYAMVKMQLVARHKIVAEYDDDDEVITI